MAGYPTGKKLGLAKGDWCYNRESGWGCRILSDVHTYAPVCMVWGYEAEAGSVYAFELVKTTKEDVIRRAAEYGHEIAARWQADVLK